MRFIIANVSPRQSRHHLRRIVSSTLTSSATHCGRQLWSAVAGNADVVIGLHATVDNADAANAALVVGFVRCAIGHVLIADPHDLPRLLCELDRESHLLQLSSESGGMNMVLGVQRGLHCGADCQLSMRAMLSLSRSVKSVQNGSCNSPATLFMPNTP